MKSIVTAILLICFMTACSRTSLSSVIYNDMQKARTDGSTARHLDLSRQSLGSWPEDLADMSDLESLVLAANGLTSVPSNLGKLKNLKKLDLSQNAIRVLPTEIGRLTNLEELSVRYCALESLPSELGYLKKLRRLDVSDNRLVSWPSELSELDSLEFLDLSANALRSAPRSLSKLKSLDLSMNPGLSEILTGWAELEELDLSGTAYTDVSFLIDFPRLRKVTLSGAPIADDVLARLREARPELEIIK